MTHNRFFVAVLVACFTLMCGTAFAESRVALVIGNGQYRAVQPLANPTRDASLVGSALSRAGFSVDLKLNLTKAQIEAELRAFNRKAANADVALIYYAGHGVQLEQDNWIVPVDAVLEQPIDARSEAVRMEDVIVSLRSARKLRIVVFDACRDNPFAMKLRQQGHAVQRGLGASRGLAPIEGLSGGTVLVFSAGPWQTASDAPAAGGQNSPFALAFARRIAEPGVELSQFLRRVRSDVMRAASPQEPWTNESRTEEDFYFLPVTSSAPLDPQAEIRRQQIAALQREGAPAAPVPQAGVASVQPSSLASDGRTRFHGSPGPDTVAGDQADNCVFGHAGDDVVRGLRGDDIMYGNDGNDRMYGGLGADIMRGGQGNDQYWGNDSDQPGVRDVSKDVFVVTNEGGGSSKRAMNFGHDTIHDFQVDKDVIHFEAMYSLFPRWSDIRDSIRDVNGNAVIDFGNASVTILGVRKSQLSVRNFSASVRSNG